MIANCLSSNSFLYNRKLQKHKLHKFEIACLANLVPADADEAKSLLPRWASELPIAVLTQCISIYLFFTCSLQGRFDDLELNELLDDIRTQMSFQY